jgi:hypothetical protein
MEKVCQVCGNQFIAKYSYQKNCSSQCAEKLRKGYYSLNVEKAKQYRIANKERYHEWYIKHREECLNYGKEKYRENRDIVRAKQREYYLANSEKIKVGSKNWRINNLDRIRNSSRIKLKEKYYNDIAYKLLVNLRCRVKLAIHKNSKTGKSLELIGCSVPELKEYLERQFKPGMSWSNYGLHGWHIDHIVPCASFDLSKEEEQRKCFHYTNLQPLWAHENLVKHTKIILVTV